LLLRNITTPPLGLLEFARPSAIPPVGDGKRVVPTVWLRRESVKVKNGGE